MFFPDRIKNISPDDIVLEIGPGGSPHSRSDIFLELKFDTVAEETLQRSNDLAMETDKTVYYYDGKKFPFEDNQFDYIICSHVLEHVEDVPLFLMELQRVASKGYLEFPTIYYDYLYNTPTHVNFLLKEKDVIYYLSHSETALDTFQPVHDFFQKTIVMGYASLVKDFKTSFFQGFEWKGQIKCQHATSLNNLTYDPQALAIPSKKKKNNFWRKLKRRLKRK